MDFRTSLLYVTTLQRCSRILSVGWEHSLALLPYGDRFRTYRRHMSRVIGSKAVAAKYDKLQEAEAGYLLLNILDKPDSIIDHIKRWVPI